MQPRFNPFRPNGIISPGMFVGRLDEITAVENFLFQTKNGNPQHFLVQGERGIGKSSLLFYLNIIAKSGQNSYSNVRFLTVEVDLGGCSTQIDIIRKIGRALRQSISGYEGLKRTASAVWDWISNWEVLGVRYHKEQSEFDTEEICEDLVRNLTDLCLRSQTDLDGVFFLIDEADRPPVDAGLGELLKMFTERLARSGCDRVVIGLAALPTIIQKLRASHESAPRLFHNFLLEPLEIEERRPVIEIGIQQANDKNAYKTNISNDAKDFLADLSEGYPHFLQQFAFSAFNVDRDGIIDIDDVSRGAFGDGGRSLSWEISFSTRCIMREYRQKTIVES
jgi:Cdc6-like AAA superfamily ATPase